MLMRAVHDVARLTATPGGSKAGPTAPNMIWNKCY